MWSEEQGLNHVSTGQTNQLDITAISQTRFGSDELFFTRGQKMEVPPF